MSINRNTESEPAPPSNENTNKVVNYLTASSWTTDGAAPDAGMRWRGAQAGGGGAGDGGGHGDDDSTENVERVLLNGVAVEERAPKKLISNFDDVVDLLAWYFRIDWRDLPILTWGKKVTTQVALQDLLAGLSVTTLLIPQALAYAKLTGVKNVLMGWYASTLPLLIYALLGSSSQLSVGPTGPVSILIKTLSNEQGSEKEETIIALTFLSGCVQLLLSLLGFGFVANLLSSPVMSGYASAAGLIIAASQLGDFFAEPVGRGKYFSDIGDFFSHGKHIQWNVAVIGLVSLAILLAVKFVSIRGKKVPRWVPTQLLLVIAATVMSIASGYPDKKFTVEHSLESGGSNGGFTFHVPDFGLMKNMLPQSFILGLIAYVCSMSLAVVFGKDVGESINPNIELLAGGAGCVATSFFKGFTSSGSFSRTAMNSELKAQTPLAGLFSGMLMLIVVLVKPIEQFIKYLPNAVLAAMIIASVISLLKYKDAIKLWKANKIDFLQMFATFWLTLYFGVADGILYSVLAALIVLLLKSFWPDVVELGRFPGTDVFVDTSRFPQAEVMEGILVIRVEGPLHFANVAILVNKLNHIFSEATKNKAVLQRTDSAGDLGAYAQLEDDHMHRYKAKLLSNGHESERAQGPFRRLTSQDAEDFIEQNVGTGAKGQPLSGMPIDEKHAYEKLFAVILDGSRISDIDSHAAMELHDTIQTIHKSPNGFVVLLASFSIPERQLFRSLELEGMYSNLAYLNVLTMTN
eukprot:gb/GECG01012642.1/.p1 GENE.gb/GECG01012642.1/~~gb/GECG01012642.1/.p1  ORF type:complete len:746 (+),score=80.49 gb/GECG01012642.1/:1-2238(+)